ncbi:bifunctional DNA primase/polymerase [Nostoc carneum NIES-2107]|nr:bifunctional DNA primase/polymerase [Nostoc carneum NIES-2107]
MDEIQKEAIAATNSDRRSKNKNSDQNSNRNTTRSLQELRQNLKLLPEDWALVAVGNNKAPLGKNWQKTPLSRQEFEAAFKLKEFKCLTVETKDGKITNPSIYWLFAFGVLCGTPSNGLLFVDHDGTSCDDLIQEISGQSLEEALPKTVTVTSGREGRYQAIYRVPKKYWGAIKTIRIKTDTQGEDGKPEQLELRWDGSQSVVVGYHPITGGYQWWSGQSPAECEIATAPLWIIEQMLGNKLPHQATQLKSKTSSNLQTWTDKDWALSYLSAIPPAEDYDTWLDVGMALHSVSPEFLPEWENWSRGASNYEENACAERWQSFTSGKGIGLGTLGFFAKENGWQSPFGTSRSESKDDPQSLSLCLEESEDIEELAQEVQNLLELTQKAAPVQSLLSSHLTIPLIDLAKRFNVPLETFIGVFLPVAASLLRVNTCIKIAAATNYFVPPILWMGLVGETGATKSPIFNSILNPLEEFQADAEDNYQHDLAQFKQEFAKWEKLPKDEKGDMPIEPVPREYYLQDATMEAIADCLNKQPNRGVILAIDELAGFFAGFNKYRSSGQGNDRQTWLSVYNGQSIKINRKTGPRVSISRTSVSVVGTIQPCVLRKHMGNLKEEDGFWSRYMWIQLPLTKMPRPSQEATHNLSALLQNLYKNLEKLAPKTYQLDQSGQQIWGDWHDWCEEEKFTEPNSALRAIYPKARERAARIALIVHCVNAVVEDRIPETIVESELLEAAIAFTKWLIGQDRLIYADSGITIHRDSSTITRFIERFKGKDWIKARQVTHWSSSCEKLTADAARAFMKQVVNLGYAVDNKQPGRAYQIKIKDNSGNTGNNAP